MDTHAHKNTHTDLYVCLPSMKINDVAFVGVAPLSALCVMLTGFMGNANTMLDVFMSTATIKLTGS